MKKTLTTSLAALAIAGMVGGGTFAAWNDADVITDNTTTAGHLLLDVNGSGKILNVGSQAIAPGENRTIDFYLSSADLDGVPLADLYMSFQNLKDFENVCLDPEADAGDSSCGAGDDQGEFSDQAYVRVRYSDPVTGGVFESNQCRVSSGGPQISTPNGDTGSNDPANWATLAEYVAGTASSAGGVTGSPTNVGQLASGQSICVRIDLGLPPTADNTTMSDSSVFDLEFDLVQS